jgi:hypothetical protein
MVAVLEVRLGLYHLLEAEVLEVIAVMVALV